MYIINGSWDVVIIFLIVSRFHPHAVHHSSEQALFWVETKGKTLEEIDAIFEGTKHSDVPDIERIRTGDATIDIKTVEEQLRMSETVPVQRSKLG